MLLACVDVITALFKKYKKKKKNGNRYRKKVHAISFKTKFILGVAVGALSIATFQFFENQAENLLELTYYANITEMVEKVPGFA